MSMQRILLSRSAAGKAILITGTDITNATPIHQTVSGDKSVDEIYLKVTNNHTEPVLLTVMWGDDDPEDVFTQVIPVTDGRLEIVQGDCLNNSHTIWMYASVPNVISVIGHVNRITNE